MTNGKLARNRVQIFALFFLHCIFNSIIYHLNKILNSDHLVISAVAFFSAAIQGVSNFQALAEF